MKRLYAIQMKDGSFWCWDTGLPRLWPLKKNAKDFADDYSNVFRAAKVVPVEIKVIK